MMATEAKHRLVNLIDTVHTLSNLKAFMQLCQDSTQTAEQKKVPQQVFYKSCRLHVKIIMNEWNVYLNHVSIIMQSILQLNNGKLSDWNTHDRPF